MSKKQSEKTFSFKKISSNFKSFKQIIQKGWLIKFSTYNSTNILVFCISLKTGTVLTQYFHDEKLAIDFINFILITDSLQ